MTERRLTQAAKQARELSELHAGHDMDCAVYNGPAHPVGLCDCGRLNKSDAAKLYWATYKQSMEVSDQGENDE